MTKKEEKKRNSWFINYSMNDGLMIEKSLKGETANEKHRKEINNNIFKIFFDLYFDLYFISLSFLHNESFKNESN